MDITTILMMFTCKFSSFAYCVEDGRQPEENLSSDQLQRRILTIPSFLEYFNYIFFFPGAIVGPAFDFIDWQDFINLRKHYSAIPFQIIESLKQLVFSFFFMGVLLGVYPYVPLEYCGSKEFADKNIFYQIIYINLSCTLARCKYHSGWTMAQSGVIACGLSYSGKNKQGENTWDQVLSVDPFLELLHSPKEKIDKWNISVQMWLKRYVYFRIYSEKEMKQSIRKTNFAQNCNFFFYILFFFSIFLKI